MEGPKEASGVEIYPFTGVCDPEGCTVKTLQTVGLVLCILGAVERAQSVSQVWRHKLVTVPGIQRQADP